MQPFSRLQNDHTNGQADHFGQDHKDAPSSTPSLSATTWLTIFLSLFFLVFILPLLCIFFAYFLLAATRDFISEILMPPDRYTGLPSKPISVYHTGPKGYHLGTEAWPVYDHAIADGWAKLGRQIFEYLDSEGVKWTSIDVTRLTKPKESGLVFLWIGVKPKSLTRECAKRVAAHCKEILRERRITDVEVGFRESVLTRLAGPKLRNYVPSTDPTSLVCIPLTPALGLQIASEQLPYYEGTGGVYIREGGDSERVFILTARHVVLPLMDKDEAYTYDRSSKPRRVLLLGRKAYQDVVESTSNAIEFREGAITSHERKLKRLGKASGDPNDTQAEKRDRLEKAAQETKQEKAALEGFLQDVRTDWNPEDQRILGHIVYSPPMSFGNTEEFTEDWALIELDRDKIDWNSFKGNVIDLGTKISEASLKSKMCPHPNADTSFQYPNDRLFHLKGFVKEEELHQPITVGENDRLCLVVIKNGPTTGLTIGRAVGIGSFTRRSLQDIDEEFTSMELAIYSCDKECAFSDPGDSGSIVADAKGRVVGLLTSGSGSPKASTDVSYATPFDWILNERIKKHFPTACLY